MDIDKRNQELAKASPLRIIEEALSQAKNPLITTNFRPYEAAILHAVTRVHPDIPVLWCDSGYNTKATYRHAHQLIEQLGLHLIVEVPVNTKAYRDIYLGTPAIDAPGFEQFVQEVKLDPFRKAMDRLAPDVWFTNLRAGQTELRSSLGIFSEHKENRLRVSPFYHWTDTDLDEYLVEHDLPIEFDYYDPTKGPEHRECGIHL